MRFRAQNSAIRELITSFRANQIVMNTCDFQIDVIIRLSNCQRAATQKRKAARQQPNRDVRDSSRGRKNLESM